MSEEKTPHEFVPERNYNSKIGKGLIEEFYKPALAECVLYQRCAGYFSSTFFIYVMKEILEFSKRNGRIQLVTSPNLSTADKDMIEKCVQNPEKILSEIFFDDLNDDPDNLKNDCAKLMGWMLAHKVNGHPQLEIKIHAGPELYHEKICIMHYPDDRRISFMGSNNETGKAMNENVESFRVFCSWIDGDYRDVVHDQRYFNELWSNEYPRIPLVDLPQAVKEHLLKIRPKSDDEYNETVENVTKKIRKEIKETKKSTMGLRDYQKEAREAWFDNNCKGLFAMATGTGKTFTAFSCINKIQNQHERTVVIIACPKKHLVEQWTDALAEYNSEMPNDDKIKTQSSVTCDSDYRGWKDWEEKFNTILYDINELPLGKEEYDENNFLVFTTHATLGLPSFNDKIDKIKNLKKFLIVDEVHGINEEGSKTRFRNDYDFRLGLSAAPTRHFDPDGTQTIYDYFDNELDKPTYSLDLETAIKKKYLCPYDYFPSYVPLTEDEMHQYRKLTSAIASVMEKKKKGTYNKKIDGEPSLRRQELVQAAENKLTALEELLQMKNNQLEQTLIYCTNTRSSAHPKDNPTQLDHVKNILSTRKPIIISDSITWKDPTKDRLRILDNLANKAFHCVTAVRCLDEGVDIPACRTAIFMASTGNPAQFIQRRGRVLRKDKKTGKTHATIYDILVIPPKPDPDDGPTLTEMKEVAKELLRHKEFAAIARNPDDARKMIEKEVIETFNIPYDELDQEWINNLS